MYTSTHNANLSHVRRPSWSYLQVVTLEEELGRPPKGGGEAVMHICTSHRSERREIARLYCREAVEENRTFSTFSIEGEVLKNV